MPRNNGSSGSLFQSAPPAKGATCGALGKDSQQSVSIRAPREGGDRVSLESFEEYGKNRLLREPGDLGSPGVVFIFAEDVKERKQQA